MRTSTKTPWQGGYFRVRRRALRLSVPHLHQLLKKRAGSGRRLVVPSLSSLYANFDGPAAPGPTPPQRWIVDAMTGPLECKRSDLWKP